MRRREFVSLSLGASAVALTARRVGAQPARLLRLTLDPASIVNPIAEDFTGVSYETAQLNNPTFFAPENAALAGFLRRLGSGVLRIGGNTSGYSVWTPEAAGATSPVTQKAFGPDAGTAASRRTAVTPLALRNLRSFLDLTGWRLIYGLNMGTEGPEIAADEAEYVVRTMGSKLIALQLCNEPDLFSKGLRGRDYDYPKFAAEWRRYFRAVRRRVPHAPFAGPDTAFHNDWLVPFAKEFRKEILFLTQHYYAEGPPQDPSMNIARLLAPNPKLAEEFAGMRETQRDTGLPFRMAETNSCYWGGKPGVSNTFASALWGADLMYQLATEGGTGINFHGGGYGWYTPVAGSQRDGFVARPLYYGILLFAQAGPGQLVKTLIENGADAPLVTAYGVKGPDGTLKVAIFNKDEERDAEFIIAPGAAAKTASMMRLFAPRPDDTDDTTLAGAPVGAAGTWAPSVIDNLEGNDGRFQVRISKASAALITFAA